MAADSFKSSELANQAGARMPRIARSRSDRSAQPTAVEQLLLERLDDPTRDSSVFDENCREWVAEVLAPRYRATEES